MPEVSLNTYTGLCIINDSYGIYLKVKDVIDIPRKLL